MKEGVRLQSKCCRQVGSCHMATRLRTDDMGLRQLLLTMVAVWMTSYVSGHDSPGRRAWRWLPSPPPGPPHPAHPGSWACPSAAYTKHQRQAQSNHLSAWTSLHRLLSRVVAIFSSWPTTFSSSMLLGLPKCSGCSPCSQSWDTKSIVTNPLLHSTSHIDRVLQLMPHRPVYAVSMAKPCSPSLGGAYTSTGCRELWQRPVSHAHLHPTD